MTPLSISDSNPDNNSAFDIASRPFLAVGSGLAYLGTPTVSIVDPASGTVVRQFDVYEQGFMGGVQTAILDVDNDGRDEIVVAPGRGRVGEVRVFDIDGEEMPEYRITPFGSSFLKAGAGGGETAVGYLGRGQGAPRARPSRPRSPPSRRAAPPAASDRRRRRAAWR